MTTYTKSMGIVFLGTLCATVGMVDAAEVPGSALGSNPVKPGVYVVQGMLGTEAITVTINGQCMSKSSGQGIIVRPPRPFGAGMVCISRQGFSYINLDSAFARSSLTQSVRPGIRGSSVPFANGSRQEIIVLPDIRQCIFNPTFDASHVWTGAADDGRFNRLGLTVVRANGFLSCLSVVNADLASFDPNTGKSFLATTSQGKQNLQPNSFLLYMAEADQIIDAIDPSDNPFYHSRSALRARPITFRSDSTAIPTSEALSLPMTHRLRPSQQGGNKASIWTALGSNGAGREVQPAFKSANWSGEIAYGVDIEQCDPTICKGIPQCVVGDGGGKHQCSVPDTVETDIYDADYNIDVSEVALPSGAVCESKSTSKPYFSQDSIWGGLGGAGSSNSLLQSGVILFAQCTNGVWSPVSKYIFAEANYAPGGYDVQFLGRCAVSTDVTFTGESKSDAPSYTTGTATVVDSGNSSCTLDQSFTSAANTEFGNSAEGIDERNQSAAKMGSNVYEPTLYSGAGPIIRMTYDATGIGNGYSLNPDGLDVDFFVISQPIASDYVWAYGGGMFDVSAYGDVYTELDACDKLVRSANGSNISVLYTFEGNATALGWCPLGAGSSLENTALSEDKLITTTNVDLLTSGLRK